MNATPKEIVTSVMKFEGTKDRNLRTERENGYKKVPSLSMPKTYLFYENSSVSSKLRVQKPIGSLKNMLC